MSTQLETFVPRVITARPAPRSGWRRMLGDWIVVSGATVLCQALGTVVSLVLRLALSPAQMGVWQALKLLLTNGNYANLGISKSAAREFSIALGRGDAQPAAHPLNLAFTVNTLSSVAYGAALVAVGIGIGCWGHGAWSQAWAVGLAAVAGLSILQRHLTFQVTLLRAKQDFATAAQLSVVEAALTLAFCGACTWLWGLAGLYAGTGAVMLGAIGFVHVRSTFRFHWAWDRAEIRRLIAIGSPIMLSGLVGTLFRILDKLMILGYLPDREYQLGCYSLALLVTGQLYGIGNMLSVVIGPRLAEHYGRSGSRRDVAGLCVLSSELLASAVTLPAALATVVLPPLFGVLLPDYHAGLAPMLWLIPGVIALSIALVPAQYLVSVDRQNWTLGSVLIATAAAAAGIHVLLRAGYGLPGVAAATSASYGFYLLLVAVPLWFDLDRPGRRRLLGLHALAVVPTLAVALYLQTRHPAQPGDWHALLVHGLLVVGVWLATLAIAWHWAGWREMLSKK